MGLHSKSWFNAFLSNEPPIHTPPACDTVSAHGPYPTSFVTRYGTRPSVTLPTWVARGFCSIQSSTSSLQGKDAFFILKVDYYHCLIPLQPCLNHMTDQTTTGTGMILPPTVETSAPHEEAGTNPASEATPGPLSETAENDTDDESDGDGYSQLSGELQVSRYPRKHVAVSKA